MQTEIIISGFGGQGTLYAGQLLAYAAMDEGKHVTWIPSYGPEMRGGTANCTVVISDDEIGSPTVLNPTAVLVMNLPSLDKYESLVKPGGWLIVNESMVNRTPDAPNAHVILLPANAIAQEIGNERAANMVMLGAVNAITGMVSASALDQAVEKVLAGKKQSLIDVNKQGLASGAQSVSKEN